MHHRVEPIIALRADVDLAEANHKPEQRGNIKHARRQCKLAVPWSRKSQLTSYCIPAPSKSLGELSELALSFRPVTWFNFHS